MGWRTNTPSPIITLPITIIELNEHTFMLQVFADLERERLAMHLQYTKLLLRDKIVGCFSVENKSGERIQPQSTHFAQIRVTPNRFFAFDGDCARGKCSDQRCSQLCEISWFCYTCIMSFYQIPCAIQHFTNSHQNEQVQ